MSQEQTLKDILEIVQFMQSEMATKQDLASFATRDDLLKVKSDVVSHVDGFIGLHQKLDIELTMLKSKYARLEQQLQRLATAQGITLE